MSDAITIKLVNRGATMEDPLEEFPWTAEIDTNGVKFKVFNLPDSRTALTAVKELVGSEIGK